MIFVIKNLLTYIRPYKRLSALFLLTLLLDLAFVSLAPLSFKYIIDNAIEPRDFQYFYHFLTVFGICAVICISSGLASDVFLAKLITKVQTDLRKRLFEHLQHIHVGYFQKKRSGELVSHFTVDLPAIESALSVLLTTGIQSLVVVVFSTAVLFTLEWRMALLILLGAFIIFTGPYFLNRRAQEANNQYFEEVGLLMSDVNENIKAQKVIKGYHLQASMIQKFQSRLQAFSIANYHKQVIDARLGRFPMASLLLVNFAIVAFGSYLALQGHVTVGAFVGFFTMYTSMGNAVFNLTYTIPAVTEASVSLERLEQVFDQPKEKRGSVHAMGENKEEQMVISAENVTFGYDENDPVLKQVTLDIPFGSKVAFVGTSGSGKSTMLQLLIGFYHPEQGQIRINGTNMQNVDQGTYRERIGIVFQDNFLFKGTILENIHLGRREATLEEVVEAAKMAEIHEYITSLPDGYQSEVLDEGSNFSGGQRQRIAIARAILRNPLILFLDEATSALDPIAESFLIRTFYELSRNRTVISVTHRLASVIEMDQIFVFDKGKLVDRGSHHEMLANGGFYQELWEKQNGLSISESGKEATIDGERLSRLPFFRGVDQSVLDDIAGLFQTEAFSTGEAIIREGEKGEKFYVMVRGRVEVTKATAEIENGSIQVAILEDGDHFGEIALLDHIPRTATITALTPCICVSLQRKVLQYILASNPKIDEYVRKTLKGRRTTEVLSHAGDI
ncbi:ABC transporter transmembrane domain-containing protein [uncultured Brevibacillus sp.]|uniref:ABC transporter transmembrane domain-containing protein n=1 Tax=uncultured Brevibacillus sp. TaxID=169970 RepID=UPI0025997C3E|nr:ABC transporter transmembrane domain-containing protein [uncultured Brevibacillus sp.]